MLYEERISWIIGTPLGLNIRTIKFVPTHMHENIIEILFCLKGNVNFSYCYEEFTLSAGEFISVDKDAHFIFDEKGENICVSFYINLEWFLEKYPFITSLLFVCEATKGSSKPYSTPAHKQMEGTLISILQYLASHKKNSRNFQNTITHGVERIIEILIDSFDIVYYYNPTLVLKKELMERNRNMMTYLQQHATEKITLETMARDFNLTKAYISEFLRIFEVGFRKSLGYIRANNSEKLLLTTDMNIVDISEACGFSDAKYYYSAFKEWYKCTPKQFRTIYRNKMNQDAAESEMGMDEILKPLNEMMLKHYFELFLY